MSQDQNRNPVLPSLVEDEQFISSDAFSSANSAFDWDTLVSRGGCSNNANNQTSGGMSRWERDSLYVNFDPLLNSKKDARGGEGDDRLSSVFKVPKLPGAFAPPPPAGGGIDVFGGGNATLISPLSDSGSYKSASQDLSPSDLLDGEFATPHTNGKVEESAQSPPASPQDQLAMGDAGSSLYAANIELEADIMKENLNETVVLVNPTLLEDDDDDKRNGNGEETSSALPMTPPPPVQEVRKDEVGASPQNNLLFSPFTVSPKKADPDELFAEFKKTVVIQSPTRAVFGYGSGDPDPELIDEEEFKNRAEQSISDDSFLEAFSRGVYIKTPARPVGIVQPHGKTPEGDKSSSDLNGTFDLTPVSASESLNVTQVLAHPDDQDENGAETFEKEEQELEELQHSQIPPPPPLGDEYYEEDGEELEERLDRTATPVIDVSFSEEDLIPTAPNSVEPPPPEPESEQEQVSCQDSAGAEVFSPSTPKMNESEENQRRLSAFFANKTPIVRSPSPNATFSPDKTGDSSGEPVANSETEASPIPPTPSPPRPPPASQEQLQRIQKLKESLAQLETEYEQQCMEADKEIAMKEAKLKTISDQVDIEATSLENLEAALELAKQERDQALDDLKQMEANFAEMLNMYENIKSLQTRVEQNCQILQKREYILAEALERKEDRDNAACQIVADCLDVMKHDFETRVKEREAENIKLKARLRMSEMSVEKMEAKMGQLDRESEKLRGLCDELLNSQGGL